MQFARNCVRFDCTVKYMSLFIFKYLIADKFGQNKWKHKPEMVDLYLLLYVNICECDLSVGFSIVVLYKIKKGFI